MSGFVMSPAREEARFSPYQQHHTLNKVKKVKSQSITPLNLISLFIFFIYLYDNNYVF